jgi:hypothetical protein
MEAKELRIGNLVYQFGIPPAVEVIRLTKDKILIDASPIPITEEWLIKFGFYEYDRMGENIFFSIKPHNDMNWNLHFNRNILSVSFKDLIWDKSFEIKHVHQLQNLYFALTGEELTIK